MATSGLQTSVDRKFYSIPSEKVTRVEKLKSDEKKNEFIEYISANIIGDPGNEYCMRKDLSGPFGVRKAIYLDYIASGKSLKFIEDYIQNEVLTDYGNTHTTTSITSLQTTLYRHEARDIIRNAVHASEYDSVIFCGNGCTAAVHKLIHALHLQKPPIVFVSPYEHHSNLLPWKEIGSEVIRIKATDDGKVCLEDLKDKLEEGRKSGETLIGCFCAASNITGILVNVEEITVILHQYGALALWDYATAAPYVHIDMNPVAERKENQPYVYKDAVFISTHKFIGGVSTPGILVAKKKLFRNPVPDKCGGGSVFFVRREEHCYLKEPELKEEGGTPDIVGSIRAGLVFQLKEAVGSKVIMEKETELAEYASSHLKKCKNLVLLGNTDISRLPVFSFLIYNPESGRFLHHNFVAAILNDVFGIQARGGCACAGPYAMDLLGLEEDTAASIEKLLAEDAQLDRTHLRRYREYSHREIIRPGFVRINLPYFINIETLEFVMEALKLTALYAYKLLPQYMFNPETGEWRQRNFQVFKDRKWLGHISYTSGKMAYKIPPLIEKGPCPSTYQECLKFAEDLFEKAAKSKLNITDHRKMFDDETNSYRWFLLPSEASNILQGVPLEKDFTLPFCPPEFRKVIGMQISDANHQNTDTSTNNIVISSKNTKKELKSMEKKGSGLDPSNSLVQNFICSQAISSIDDESTDLILKTPGKNCFTSSDNYPAKVLSKPNVDNDDNSPILTSQASSSQDVTVSTQASSAPSGINQVPQTPSIQMTCDLSACKKRKVEPKAEKSNISISSKAEKANISISSKDIAVSQANTKVEAKKARKKDGWFSPPKTIFNPFLKAVEEYSMIKSGDKILVCLSGGKDSLSLLHTIRQYQFYCRSKGIKFEFGAVTVDPETPSYDPSPLKAYLASLGVPYFYESQCIMETAKNLPEECSSICSFCSRMKRGRIYACARREGYNVLALGQHLDDLSESFFMSVFHNGLLRTMKAHYTVEEGDLRVIRPFVYVREKDLRDFALRNCLPVIAENCPACFEMPKERHRIKQLLASQEILFPQVFSSLLSAIKPIMAINKTQVKLSDSLKVANNNQDDMEI